MNQEDLFTEGEPQSNKDKNDISILEDLFNAAKHYKKSKEYLDLLKYISKFPAYSPYNCFLLYVQNPGVRYVATPRQWEKRFQRTIKEGARPLIILAPMSPVLFVYDVADTEGTKPFPEKLLNPFKGDGHLNPSIWNHTVDNLFRDRIKLVEVEMPSGAAGYIRIAELQDTVTYKSDRMREPLVSKALYKMVINSTFDKVAKYATLLHELGHLYCGHLGTPNEKWWPDRRRRSLAEREFEAESISYLICERSGLKNPSAAYLSNYFASNDEIPDINPDLVLKVAGYIESMGKRLLESRKEK
jgi:hypothetical protein